MTSAANHLRVGIVCHSTLGGSSRMAVRLAAALCDAGHEVHLICETAPPWPVAEGVELHVGPTPGVRRSSSGFDPNWSADRRAAFRDRLVDVIRSNRLDVVHVHYLRPFVSVAAEANLILGDSAVPVVATAHGTDVPVSGRLTDDVEANLCALAASTAVSAHLRDRWIAATEALAPEVVPNFVEDSWGEDIEIGGSKRPRILHVSNYRTVKNSGLLVPLFQALRRRLDVDLMLVGDGPDLSAVRAGLAREESVGVVRSIGVTTSIEALLPGSGLLLMTSEHEGFGLAALEAMAAGVPVAAPRWSGLAELVDDGRNGVLYDPGGIAAAADIVAAVLADRARLELMGRAAKTHAEQYRQEHIVPRYVQVYERMVAGDV